MSPDEIQRLVHELQVHQIELEIQNEELRAAQAEIAQTRDRFNDLYDFAPVGYVTLDEAGTVTEANLTAARMLGVARRNLIGRKFTPFVARTAQDVFRLHQRAMIGRGKGRACELRLKGPDGREFFALMESVVFHDPADGIPRQIRSALSDITALRRARESLALSHAELEHRVIERTAELREANDRLRLSEVCYRQLFHALPVAAHTCDAQGRITLFNAAAANLWGQEPDSRRSRWCGARRAFTADGKPLSKEFCPVAQTVREGEAVRDTELIIERPDGSRAHVLVFPDPIHDDTGAVTGAVVIQVEITALKVAENSLRTSERNLRKLSRAVEQSPSGVVITSRSGEFEYVNPKFTEVTGYSLEELRGKTPRVLKSGAHPDALYREMWATVTAGRDWRSQVCNRKKNGELYWAFVVIAPILDESGEITHFVALQEDITERRLAAAEIQDREERLRAILNTVTDAIITIDRRGMITGVNPATARMFGYTEAEMVGQNVSLLMPAPYRVEHDGYLARYERTGQARIIGIGREVSAQRKDGTVFPIELAVGEVDHMHLFTGIIRDITRRRRLEGEVMRIAEEERQRVAADLHDGICQELVGIQYLSILLLRELEKAGHPLVAQARRIEEAVIAATEHTRQTARGLSPVVGDGHGLMHALRTFAGMTARQHRMHCTLHCPLPVLVENQTAADQLYRIAQEAVLNARRHGHARRISVRLTGSGGGLRLAILDDGTGLPANVEAATGMGLRVMHYRARQIGGELTVRPRRGGGTEVVCRLPNNATQP